MCFYTDMPYIYGTCERNPNHVVVHRVYKICPQPRNVGTYRHCSDEYAKPCPDFAFGSSRVNGPCPTCVDDKRTRVITYIDL